MGPLSGLPAPKAGRYATFNVTRRIHFGTLTQFHTGSIFRAINATSDFTLVELVGAPVASYQHFWAGWGRSTGNFACSASTLRDDPPPEHRREADHVLHHHDGDHQLQGHDLAWQRLAPLGRLGDRSARTVHLAGRDRAGLVRLAALQPGGPIYRPASWWTVQLWRHGEQSL